MKRTLCALAIALGGAAPTWGQPERLGEGVRPLWQRVQLRTDPAQSSYSGSTRIGLKLDRASASFRLHAVDLRIKKAVLHGVPLKVEAQPPTLLLTAPRPLSAGEYQLQLDFVAAYNTHSQGLYRFRDGGRAYLSTQFEMSEARRCFPCFDEPAFKIPFQLSVAAPSDQNVYSNSPQLGEVRKGNWTTHEFARTPPMPSYLVALAVGPYQSAAVHGMSVPGRIVAPQGKLGLAQFSRQNTPKIVRALERYFDIPYAYSKLDQIAISEFPYGAMENAGLITYREDILLVNQKTASQDSKTLTLMVISHELAHQWFGNLVTMKWWNDLWLNEAFASWMASKLVNQLYPELEYFLETPQNHVMTQDANLSSKPIRKPIRNEADIMDGLGLAYNKGESVLNMVERWLGEETFRQGIRRYLLAHRFGNAEAADLWQALEAVSHQDVGSVLKSFTEQSGYPLLTFAVQGKTLTLQQQRFVAAGVVPPAQQWTLPVFVRYGRGGQTAQRNLLLEGASAQIELDFEPEWIFPDDGGVGYYRWLLEPTALRELAQHSAPRLSNREKLAFLYNVKGLNQAGLISAGDRLLYSQPLVADFHPAVAASALMELDSMASLFVDESNQGLWRSYMQRVLPPLVERYGLLPRAHEHPKVEELRPVLLVMLARYGVRPEVTGVAREGVRLYLAGSDEVEPSLVDAYLQIALREAGAEMVDEVKTAMLKASDPQRRTELLTALGLFGQPQAQQKAMDLMLDGAVTPSDLRTLLGANAIEEVRRQRLQGWIFANFAALRQKIPTPFLASVVGSLSGARDAQSLAAIVDFLNGQPDPDGVLKRELEKLSERVKARIAERERGLKSFEAALRR